MHTTKDWFLELFRLNSQIIRKCLTGIILEFASWTKKGIQKGTITDASEGLMNDMKAFMNHCYATKPEDFCLKTLFDAAYFWN